MSPSETAFPNVTVVDHPLVRDRVARLRDRQTSTPEFRRLVREIGALLAYPATTGLSTRLVEVDTPFETTAAETLARPPTVVPILRAGLALAEGVLSVLSEARIGHLGLRRDEKTLEPVSYYAKMPPQAEAGLVIVADPMLATGGTAVRAFADLKARGCRRLVLVAVVAAPDGARRMLAQHPDVPVLVGALDRRLDEHGFIRPGIGDAGDRINGTLREPVPPPEDV